MAHPNKVVARHLSKPGIMSRILIQIRDFVPGILCTPLSWKDLKENNNYWWRLEWKKKLPRVGHQRWGWRGGRKRRGLEKRCYIVCYRGKEKHMERVWLAIHETGGWYITWPASFKTNQNNIILQCLFYRLSDIHDAPTFVYTVIDRKLSHTKYSQQPHWLAWCYTRMETSAYKLLTNLRL